MDTFRSAMCSRWISLAGRATVAAFAFMILAAGAIGSENEFIKIEPGKGGLAVSSKATGAAVEILLADAKGQDAGKPADSQVKLAPNKSFIEAAPIQGGLKVKGAFRFAVVPGYHIDDTLFDPAVAAAKSLSVPAEMCLLLIPEGGKSAFVLMWSESGKQFPSLVPSGKGAAARFEAVWIPFGGKPVFLGLLDHVGYVEGLDKDLGYNRNVEDGNRGRGYKYAEVKTGVQLAFNAIWWTVIAKPVGRPDEKQPAWMRCPDKAVAGVPTWIWIVGNPGSQWGDILDWYQRASVSVNGEWTLHLDKRWQPYHAALVYPRSRASKAPNTPQDKVTLSDLLCETLGRKEVEALIDYPGLGAAGVKIPKGEPSIPATCGGWSVLPDSLKAKNKDKFTERAQACYNFCFYNKARTDEYRGAAKEIAALCAKSASDAKLKTLAETGARYAEEVEKFWNEENGKFRSDVKAMAPKYPDLISAQDAEKVNLDAEYFRKLKEYYVRIFESWAEKDNAKAMSMILRSHWTMPGGMLDGMVYYERKMLQRIGQEVTLAGAETPEACAAAFAMRSMLQKALRAPHYKEEPLPPDMLFKGGR